MKKVMMKITGKQVDSENSEDKVEFMTEGSLYERNGSLYLLYEESEVSGMPGFKTRLKLTGDTVKMKRTGPGIPGTEMEFRDGQKYESYYYTPYGPFEMELITERLENNLTADGTGNVLIVYSMSLKGLVESHNELSIELL